MRDLLKSVAIALDVGQRDAGGFGMVMRSFFLMEQHFGTYAYPSTFEGRQLNTHCLGASAQRLTYLMRPVHTLTYLLDPRYTRAAEQPS